MVRREGLGSEARQAQRAPQGQGRGRAQARSHSALHVDRRDRVQLVEEGDCCLASRMRRSCSTAGKDVPAGTMAMVSSSDFLRAPATADRDCNIESPASPYVIMRRAYPYRGENSGPGKDIVGKLDTQTRKLENGLR